MNHCSLLSRWGSLSTKKKKMKDADVSQDFETEEETGKVDEEKKKSQAEKKNKWHCKFNRIFIGKYLYNEHSLVYLLFFAMRF